MNLPRRMNMRTAILLMLPLLAVAGCAAESRLAPVSTVGNSSGSSMSEPEPANSLPRGSSVSEPLTGPMGNVGTTRAGPSAVRATGSTRGAY